MRTVTASGEIRIKDDEIFSDEFGTLNFSSPGSVSADQPSVALVNTSKCVGGEVRFELELSARLLNGGNVRIDGEARLFEGTNCSTNDLEDTQQISFTVPRDSTGHFDVRVESTGPGGGDWARGRISVSNREASSEENSFSIDESGNVTFSDAAASAILDAPASDDPDNLDDSESLFGSKHTYCCTMSNSGVPAKRQQFRAYSWQAPLFCIRMAKSNGYNSGSVSRGRCRTSEFGEGDVQIEPELESSTTRFFSRDSLNSDRFSWATAISMAIASKLAYESPSKAVRIARNSLNMGSVRFFDKEDTQCLTMTSDGVMVIAFRGTESVGDWARNIDLRVIERSYGKIHRGFYHGFTRIRDELRSQIEAVSPSRILLTGHSLGGALATVAAAEWARSLPLNAVYTFGQPAVGKRGFDSRLRSLNVFRVVNDDDIVAMLPPGFVHTGQLLHLMPDGTVGESALASSETMSLLSFAEYLDSIES